MLAVRQPTLGQQELLLDTAGVAEETKLFAVPGVLAQNKGPFGSVAPHAHHGLTNGMKLAAHMFA